MSTPERIHTELHDELHARPSLAIPAPAVMSYWAQRDLPAAAVDAALQIAAAHAGQPALPLGARHGMLTADTWALKYERHGEFVSWQLRQTLDLPADAPQDGSVLAQWLQQADARNALPAAFLQALAGAPMLAATHVLVYPADEDMALPLARRAMAAQLPVFNLANGGAAPDLLGAWVAERKAALLTYLRLDAEGFTRFLLLDLHLTPQQRRLEVQRVVEVEGYRALAMLGFPQAQRESQALGETERHLLQAVDRLAETEGLDNTGGQHDQQVFADLLRIASEVEHAAARSRYRFSATRAYHRIVQRRLADLGEERIEGVQPLGRFLARRFTPAMEFCDSTDARLTDVAARVQRAVDLTRVRIDSRRDADNQQVFQALARRQHLQLRLQQTVEGLSVVAISYYAVSLLAYVFKMLKTVPAIEALHIPVEAATGASVVPVVLLVTWFVRRIREHHTVD